MIRTVLLAVVCLLLQACGGYDPVAPERYAQTDRFAALIRDNIEQDSALALVADIDHSRLGHEAGSPMPPARALIFSDVEMETALIQRKPLLALELPLRVLAFESSEGESRVIHNNFDYLVSRYQLEEGEASGLRRAYEGAVGVALAGLPAEARASFDSDSMQPDGVITLASPYNFEETVERVEAAIDAQDDTQYFGKVDFKANAKNIGVELRPSYMILFGAPGPGGKAMAGAPTLGLDGFCQKFLIWQDTDGVTYLSFNDLLALAKRQQVSIPLALRVIDFRLTRVFEQALAPG